MSRSLLVVPLLCAFAAAALNADSVDPYIHIGDPATGTPVGTTFSFASNMNGGGVFFFVNASNVTFTSLDFFVTLPSTDTITCVPQPFFSSCASTSQPVAPPNSLFDISADMGPGSTGILPGSPFNIILNDPIDGKDNFDPNGTGGWGSGTVFNVVANLGTTSTPEPATWGLFAAGLCGAVAFARKRRV